MKLSKEKVEAYKLFDQLSKSDVWKRALRPFLESLKFKVATSKRRYSDVFEAAAADVERTTTLNVVDTIIEKVDMAGDRLAGLYEDDNN